MTKKDSFLPKEAADARPFTPVFIVASYSASKFCKSVEDFRYPSVGQRLREVHPEHLAFRLMRKSNSSGAPLSSRKPSANKRGGRDQSRKKPSTASDEKSVDSIFSAFDVHCNGRITRENIRSVATEHGVDLTNAELNDMISFFDSSGTATLSRADFELVLQQTSS